MNITDVNKNVKGHKRRKRLGRGAASGAGKTCGRGTKGLGSRAGATYLKGFVGGQSPIMVRLPKRGFNNANFRTEYIPVNLSWLDKTFNDGDTVGLEELKAHGIKIGRSGKIKVLGKGELKKKLQITVHAFSKSAAEKVVEAGGTATAILKATDSDDKASK